MLQALAARLPKKRNNKRLDPGCATVVCSLALVHIPNDRERTKEKQYATRSLLSRSRVDWAIEAARRVGAEPVGALGEAGLRGSAGAPTDASSKRPASSEGDRRAEEGS